MEKPLQPISLKKAGTGGGSTIKMAVNVRCLKRPIKKLSKLTDAIKKPEKIAEIEKPKKPEEPLKTPEPIENPKVLKKESSVTPALGEMIGNTIDPIAKVIGQDVDETIDNQIRRRNTVTSGPGKVKLSAQYNPVSLESLLMRYYLRRDDILTARRTLVAVIIISLDKSEINYDF